MFNRQHGTALQWEVTVGNYLKLSRYLNTGSNGACHGRFNKCAIRNDKTVGPLLLFIMKQ